MVGVLAEAGAFDANAGASASTYRGVDKKLTCE
jgi:hypothetical protein